MNAPFLLATLRERGARVSMSARDGATLLVVTPRGIAGDLAGDVARFKPGILELLETEQRDAGELARTILECRRPDAGFDFGKLRPFWYAAIELTGVQMDSAQLGQWAREICTR